MKALDGNHVLFRGGGGMTVSLTPLQCSILHGLAVKRHAELVDVLSLPELDLLFEPILRALSSSVEAPLSPATNGEVHPVSPVLDLRSEIGRTKKRRGQAKPEYRNIVAMAADWPQGSPGLVDMLMCDPEIAARFGRLQLPPILNSQRSYVSELRALPAGDARYAYLQRHYGLGGGDHPVTLGDQARERA